MHWFVRLLACYPALVCQLCLATEYPVIARKGADLPQTDLGATAKGSTTPTLSLNSVRIPTVSDFVAGSNVSITTSGATVTIAATATDNGITTLTLSGAGVVDVTTSAPNYARIGLSSLSPRTDQMTTWTQTFTAPNIYATGKYYGDGSALTGLTSNHNSLSGIQGGAAGDYYHVTSANASKIHDQNTDTRTTNDGFWFATSKDLTFSSATLAFGHDSSKWIMYRSGWYFNESLYLGALNLLVGPGAYGDPSVALYVDGDYYMNFESFTPRIVGYSPFLSFYDQDEGVDNPLTYVLGTGLVWGGDFTANAFIGDGSGLTNVTASVLESTTDSLTLTDQATTPSTPASGYSKLWVRSGDSGTVGAGKECVMLLHFDGTLSSTLFTNDGYLHTWVRQRTGCNLDTSTKKFGTASLFCDGTDDFADGFPLLVSDMPIARDWTVECWIKTPGGASATQGIIHGALASVASAGEWSIYLSSGLPTFDHYDYRSVANPLLQGSVSLNDNSWHHIAVTQTHLSTGYGWAMYVDGASVDTASGLIAAATHWSYFYIGAQYNTASTYFRGWIDEVALWNKCRYTGAFTAPTKAYGKPSTLFLLDSNGDNYELR